MNSITAGRRRKKTTGGEAGLHEAPRAGELHRAPERRAEARADGAAGDLLGGGGEAVEEIAADMKKCIRMALAASDHRAELRALAGEEREGGQKREGTDHDVAVDPSRRRKPLRSRMCASDGRRGRAAQIHQKRMRRRRSPRPRSVPRRRPGRPAEPEDEIERSDDVEAGEERLQDEDRQRPARARAASRGGRSWSSANGAARCGRRDRCASASATPEPGFISRMPTRGAARAGADRDCRGRRRG